MPQGWQRTLWVMVGVQFIMSLSVTVISPILPLFLPQLGVHDAAAIDLWSGVLNSASFLMAALLSPLWGLLSDRYGRKVMVLRAAGGSLSAPDGTPMRYGKPRFFNVGFVAAGDVVTTPILSFLK